jgi:glycosyltransferase involved in cell wall biosynthesis
MARTRVLVDARSLTNDSSSRGIGRYVREILGGLASTELGMVAFADNDVGLDDRVAQVRVSRSFKGRLAALEDDARLARDIRRIGGDVYFSPDHAPPRRCSIPWVQTIYDVTPLLIDDVRFGQARRRLARLAPRFRAADAIIAVSRFSADQAVAKLGVSSSRVTVIHLAAAREFHPGPPLSTSSPYVLAVGVWGPHKGFGEAIGVIEEFRRAALPHRLVIAGRQDAYGLEQLRDLASASAARERIDIVGYVGDLADLYRGAAVVLAPSRSEGFGLPALEALACGTPVVAFANTAQPEVLGDGAWLVDDGDVAAMAKAARDIAEHDRIRHEWSERGVARAQIFSWTATVAAHREVLLRAAGL